MIRINSPGQIVASAAVKLIGPAYQSIRLEKKELSVAALNMGAVPADLPQEKDLSVDCAQRPMSQQDAANSHGHEMHPQKFVRLVGCHESNPDKPGAPHRLY